MERESVVLNEILSKATERFMTTTSKDRPDGQGSEPYDTLDAAQDSVQELVDSGLDIRSIAYELSAKTSISPSQLHGIKDFRPETWDDFYRLIAEDIIMIELENSHEVMEEAGRRGIL